MVRISRSRVRRTLVRVLAGVFALSLLPHGALGYSLLRETGSVGVYEVADTDASPGGRCAYGEPNADGVARFVWMRVKPPRVRARDITPERDHQAVEWRFRLQRGPSETGPWSTVKSSAWERARAHDDASADFDPHRLTYSTRGDWFYRAVMQIRWRRAGVVEGAVALWIDRYSARWTVGDPSFIFDGSCWNRAD